MKPPTPLELMAYADRELSASRTREIEAWLAEHPGDARSLSAQRALGELVRRAGAASGERRTDDIMATIDAEAAPRVPVSLARARRDLLARGAATALLTAAAASALWSSSTRRSPHSAPSAAIAFAPPPASESEQDDAAGEGTSVDEVDFGAHRGAIFYVPGEKHTTTVVWITDEDATP